MNSFIRSIKCIALLTLITGICNAQDNKQEDAEKNNKDRLNTVTIGIGRAHDISSDADISNMGFDYIHRFHHKWEWGIQLDLDWEKNFVEFEGVQLAGIIVYSITQKWPVFGGLGIAEEEGHTKGFLRIGTEYTFFLDREKRLFIAPGTFLDTTTEGVTPSVLLAIGWMW